MMQNKNHTGRVAGVMYNERKRHSPGSISIAMVTTPRY
jgi:hypothetical protein